MDNMRLEKEKNWYIFKVDFLFCIYVAMWNEKFEKLVPKMWGYLREKFIFFLFTEERILNCLSIIEHRTILLYISVEECNKIEDLFTYRESRSSQKQIQKLENGCRGLGS